MIADHVFLLVQSAERCVPVQMTRKGEEGKEASHGQCQVRGHPRLPSTRFPW